MPKGFILYSESYYKHLPSGGYILYDIIHHILSKKKHWVITYNKVRKECKNEEEAYQYVNEIIKEQKIHPIDTGADPDSIIITDLENMLPEFYNETITVSNYDQILDKYLCQKH